MPSDEHMPSRNWHITNCHPELQQAWILRAAERVRIDQLRFFGPGFPVFGTYRNQVTIGIDMAGAFFRRIFSGSGRGGMLHKSPRFLSFTTEGKAQWNWLSLINHDILNFPDTFYAVTRH